jgi:hypothetical protein
MEMRMKMMRFFAALVAGAAMLFAPALMAQDAPATPKSEDKPAEKPKEPEKAPEKDGDKKEEPKEGEKKDGEKKEEESKWVKVFKDLDQVIGKVEATDEDVKQFIKHYPAFDKLTDADEKFQKLTSESMKQAYEHLLKSEKYIAWAKENSLDAEKFLKSGFRIYMMATKALLLDAKEAEIKENKKKIEDMKNELSEEELKGYMEMVESVLKDIAEMRKAMNVVSGPTDAEKKVLETNKTELLKLIDGGDEEDADDDEKEDGMGGK